MPGANYLGTDCCDGLVNERPLFRGQCNCYHISLIGNTFAPISRRASEIIARIGASPGCVSVDYRSVTG